MTVNPCVSRVRDVLNSIAKNGAVVVSEYPPFPHCEHCSDASGVPYCVKYPLHAAAMMGELSLLKKATARKAAEWCAEYDSRGYAVLHCAVAKGQRKVIAWLLSIGADPNVVTETTDGPHDAWTGTPLYLATGVSTPDRAKIIALLLTHMADPNHPAARDPINGASVLHNAAFFGELAAVRALIKHGADVHAVTCCGETVSMHAHKGMAYASSPHGELTIWPGVGTFMHSHAAILTLLEKHGGDCASP